jgi:tyrosine-protein phosphatase YwqE
MSAVKQILSKGALLQINKTSLFPKNGFEIYDFTMWLLSKGYASFVASDAHDMQYRTTDMQRSFMKIFSEVSKKYAEDLFFNNPNAVILGEKINTRW